MTQARPMRSLSSKIASWGGVAMTMALGALGLYPFVMAMYHALLDGELPGRVTVGEQSRQGFVLAISIVTAGLLLCAIIALRRFRSPGDRDPYNPPSFSTGVAIILIGAALAAIAVSQ